MRKNDVELIAALVEGRLEDEAEARALVASSPAHQAEYESQKLAYETLSNLPTVELTDHERSALRRDVWTELQRQPEAAVSRSPWYLRWAGAAASLFVLVGLVAVLTQLGGQDDAGVETFSEIGSALDDAAAATTAGAGGAEELAGDGGGDSTGQSSAADSADPTTAADSGEVDPPVTDFEFAAVSDLANTLKSQPAALEELAIPAARSLAIDEVEDCVSQAGLADHEVAAQIELGGLVLAVATPEGGDVAEGPTSFVRLDTCEVVPTE